MIQQDFDEAVRRRAYEIWMREGCPSGREHVHWAQAAEEIESEAMTAQAAPEPEPLVVAQPWQSGAFTGRAEIERLRRALWEPQPFAA